jgi:chromosome segregation ATPase
MKNVFRRTLGLAVALSLGTLVGCSSDKGRDRAQTAITSLKDTRTELADASKQVDMTNAALDGLQAPDADLTKQYSNYKTQVAKMEDQALSASNRAAAMRGRAAEYQEKWKDEMAAVTDPTLKAAAEARAAKVRDRFATIQNRSQDIREAYQPYIQQLKEIQVYLSNDLTPASVKAGAPAFTKAKTAGENLKAKIAAGQAELDSVTGEMSAKMPPPAK